MKLTRARVTNYRSIDDSGWVSVDDVTCLVGKNESGKTAFLGALKKLGPVHEEDGSFDIKDYPRKGYVKYKREHKDKPTVVVRAEFVLTAREIEDIESEFGPGVLKSSTITVSKDYDNQRFWQVEVDEQAAVRHVLVNAGIPVEIQQHVGRARTWQELVSRLEALEVKPSSVEKLLLDLKERVSADITDQIIERHLVSRLPKFVYFDEYSTMRGRISIQDIRERHESGDLDEADRTFLSLLNLVGADLEDMESETNYEYLKAELESASIGITDDIFEFWNQNKQIRVEFDLSNANPNDPPPLNSGTILHVRIWNNRHRVSVPFDERSKGFVWFFSFLSYFSQLEAEDHGDLILLLDEPGLNLHAMAQGDFLRFIEERLAPKHQVIYTTHSPFMINLDRLSRIRTVQDVDDRGTVVSDDMLSNDRETVFPLQVALGYHVAQTLLLAPHCLMVNSPSDLIYLQVLGELVTSKGRPRLDPRWVVIPVGGVDNLSTFVSLLGENYTSVAVLMDVTPASKERLSRINENGVISRRNPVKWVEVTRVRNADIEDLFEPHFYLKLVNESFAELREPLTMRAISDSNPRIVPRIEAYFKSEGICEGRFDPYRPAAYLLQKHAQLRYEIDDGTIERAASMLERVNALLPSNGASAGAAMRTSPGRKAFASSSL